MPPTSTGVFRPDWRAGGSSPACSRSRCCYWWFRWRLVRRALNRWQCSSWRRGFPYSDTLQKRCAAGSLFAGFGGVAAFKRAKTIEHGVDGAAGTEEQRLLLSVQFLQTLASLLQAARQIAGDGNTALVECGEGKGAANFRVERGDLHTETLLVVDAFLEILEAEGDDRRATCLERIRKLLQQANVVFHELLVRFGLRHHCSGSLIQLVRFGFLRGHLRAILLDLAHRLDRTCRATSLSRLAFLLLAVLRPPRFEPHCRSGSHAFHRAAPLPASSALRGRARLLGNQRVGHFLAVRLVRAPLHLGLQRGNLLRADLWDAGCLRRQALEFRMPAGRLERVLSLHLASVGRT